uniref:Uncharacterized protein n=1 Tax=Pongo abelii TaxID=9601 RepID=A0A8I5T897_PONAB
MVSLSPARPPHPPPLIPAPPSTQSPVVSVSPARPSPSSALLSAPPPPHPNGFSQLLPAAIAALGPKLLPGGLVPPFPVLFLPPVPFPPSGSSSGLPVSRSPGLRLVDWRASGPGKEAKWKSVPPLAVKQVLSAAPAVPALLWTAPKTPWDGPESAESQPVSLSLLWCWTSVTDGSSRPSRSVRFRPSERHGGGRSGHCR